jgi:hypothetical protein
VAAAEGKEGAEGASDENAVEKARRMAREKVDVEIVPVAGYGVPLHYCCRMMT